jgi:peptidoglycan/LPS O-acetylase OafA/YrhL
MFYSLAVHQMPPVSLWAKYIFYYSSLYLGQPDFPAYNVPLFVALGFAVLWSLSVEEIFYVLWAPIIRVIRQRYLLILLPLLIFLCPILRWNVHTLEHPECFTFYFRMDALSLGALIAIAFRNHQAITKKLIRWNKMCNYLCLILTIIVVIFFAWSSGSLALRKVAVVGMFIADLWFASLIYYAVRYAGENTPFLRMLRGRTLGRIGKISYSLYLVHYPLRVVAINLCAHLHLSRRSEAIAVVLVGLVLSFCAAYGMWYVVEAPSLRLKDRMFPSKGPDFRAGKDRNARLSSEISAT